jgi:dTDP-4-dehydrorhamnose 3,5-epimerase
MAFDSGEQKPQAVIVPAGVVHAYKNIGLKPGWVINLPNRLYAGRGRKETVDEIRHESDPNSPFQMD